MLRHVRRKLHHGILFDRRLVANSNLTLVFHKGVKLSQLELTNRQHLFPQDAYYFVVTNGSLTLLFFV